ncbi:Inosine/uridine-preferring nucleoside hydrolase domain-containing protein [Multifurca ochricompacta]|uniref:Inosine/uridine-preferring nucleoside hydrolase domain-containing protein n=1 Tax=Multifurca ochricompacta TaxID=376703 RepID=A0AAD4M417_9AGAM|nr:Inosine/uridine-preferring nucleoside hydrolase domain-containing protein [Multifurca ochricompacta]
MSNKSSKIPVIIDTDPGVDDAIAILLALASPEIEILAYIVSFGNTDVEACYLNIFKIYQAVGRHIEQHPEFRDLFPNYNSARKPLVVRGPAGPLSGDLRNAAYFHGRDGLSNITESHPEFNVPPGLLSPGAHPQLEISDHPGHQVALELLREHAPRSVTYIALGPLSNLANMLRTDAVCVRERIGRVVIMGGALDVPGGNISPCAEFNFFSDPYAVDEVLISPTTRLPLARVLLLPLDITTTHLLPFVTYTTYVDPTFAADTPSVAVGKTPLAHFTSAFLRRPRAVMRGFGRDGIKLHDITAVWAAIAHPPGLEGTAPGTGEHTRGMCVVDRRDGASAYAPRSNRSRVQAALESRIAAGLADDEQEGVPVVQVTPGPEASCNL